MPDTNVPVPRRWWWLVAVAVPLLGALVVAAPDLIGALRGGDGPSELSERVKIVNAAVPGGVVAGGDVHQGDRIETRVAIAFAAPELPAADADLLARALAMLGEGDFAAALPALQALAEAHPSPALLNNLAAAHLALGERKAARAALEQARAFEAPAEPDLGAALNWNARLLAAGPGPSDRAFSPERETIWEGVVVRVMRFEDTGGMLTVEALYRNRSSSRARFCPNLSDARLIDERTGESWEGSFHVGHNCSLTLEPGETFPAWIKFRVDAAEHPRLTLDLYGTLPFEGLAPAPSAN